MRGPVTSGADAGGVECAARHALGWLVFGNGVGLLLSLLLLRPEWQPAEWTYGRWVPLHLNAQLYGWTALPLVAWLLRIYGVDDSPHRRWGAAAVWAWTAALGAACIRWLGGETSGKIFLDWRNGSLWGFIAALVVLWMVLALSFRSQSRAWSRMRRNMSLAGLVVLALVPLVMVAAASPGTYPPVDRTTGGPTGSSLLGSTLAVIGLMLLLPRAATLEGRGRAAFGTWAFFILSWLAFGVAEVLGGGHHDFRQIGSMLLLLPWGWLLPRDWSGFRWPGNGRAWRMAMLGWWGVLVLSGVLMYLPGALDRLKFTQALVAHSHLAMAGFTTSFCAVLLSLLTGRITMSTASIVVWNAAALVMIAALAVMGWREGGGAEWMILGAGWRETGFAIRAACGGVMLAASLLWLVEFSRKPL